MSEMLRFSSKEIKTWLERETGSIFVPVHARAHKLVEEMRKTLEVLKEITRGLLDNSAKEIEKRNMKVYRRARALNKLGRLFLERVGHLTIPDRVSYDTFSDFVQETQKVFAVTDIDVRNWFPRISPFFILDRRKFLAIFERAKEQLKDLTNFLMKEYVKTKTLEETFQQIDKLAALEQQLKDASQRMTKIGQAKELVEKEIATAEQSIVDMRSAGSISQLHQTGAEIDALSEEVKLAFQHLQKPFVKLQSLATHGEGSGLTPEELQKLDQYLTSPFEAFSTEAVGHPTLRQILQKLNRSISEGKLKLKPEKTRKAQQAVENILGKDSLSSLHQRCSDAMTRKTQLSTSAEVAATQQNLAKLRDEIGELKKKKEVVETEEFFAQRTCIETAEKIQNLKSEIEKNTFSFTSKKVTLV